MPKASVATDGVDLKRRGAAFSGIAPNLEVKPAYWNAVLGPTASNRSSTHRRRHTLTKRSRRYGMTWL